MEPLYRWLIPLAFVVLAGVGLYRWLGGPARAPAESPSDLISANGQPTLAEFGMDTCAGCMAMRQALDELRGPIQGAWGSLRSTWCSNRGRRSTGGSWSSPPMCCSTAWGWRSIGTSGSCLPRPPARALPPMDTPGRGRAHTLIGLLSPLSAVRSGGAWLRGCEKTPTPRQSSKKLSLEAMGDDCTWPEFSILSQTLSPD